MKKKPAEPAPPTKGHWPKGKRRNADSGEWSKTRLSVIKLIEDHWARGVISQFALANVLGVNRSTVKRWLDGIDRPSVEYQGLISAWVGDVRSGLTKGES